MAGFPGKNQLAEKAKQPRPGIPLALNRDKIAQGVIKTYGNLSRVADSIGCSRYTLRRYIEKDPELRQVLADARERVGDLLEDTAVNQALDGNSSMTMFLLRCRHKDRGYTFERDNDSQDLTRAALDYIVNRSKNPAEPV